MGTFLSTSHLSSTGKREKWIKGSRIHFSPSCRWNGPDFYCFPESGLDPFGIKTPTFHWTRRNRGEFFCHVRDGWDQSENIRSYWTLLAQLNPTWCICRSTLTQPNILRSFFSSTQMQPNQGGAKRDFINFTLSLKYDWSMNELPRSTSEVWLNYREVPMN